MAAGNDVDVFRAAFLEREADVGEDRRRHGLSHAVLRYLVVLAKQAAEVAAGDKNGTRSARTGYRRLFPEMEAGPGNPDSRILAAEASPACIAVDAAIARTDATRLVFFFHGRSL